MTGRRKTSRPCWRLEKVPVPPGETKGHEYVGAVAALDDDSDFVGQPGVRVVASKELGLAEVVGLDVLQPQHAGAGISADESMERIEQVGPSQVRVDYHFTSFGGDVVMEQCRPAVGAQDGREAGREGEQYRA